MVLESMMVGCFGMAAMLTKSSGVGHVVVRLWCL